MQEIDYNSLNAAELKTLEQKLRRKLRKNGEYLRKGRGQNSNGYMIVDENKWVVAGESPIEYSMSIEDVVKYVDEL